MPIDTEKQGQGLQEETMYPMAPPFYEITSPSKHVLSNRNVTVGRTPTR